MKTRSITALFAALTLTLAFGLSTTHAQDLEDDAGGPAGDLSSPAPSSDLNDAVDQLSKEQGRAGADAPPPRPAPNRVTPPQAPAHGMGKPFAQQAKGKHPKRKPVKIARKTASKAAKKAGKSPKKKH